jgi:hypothetical protein
MGMNYFCIILKQLDYKPFEGMIIDCGVWVEELKVDVDKALLGGL